MSHLRELGKKQFQCLICRDLFEPFSPETIQLALHDCIKIRHQRHKNCSIGFVLSSATRPRDSRYRYRKIRAEPFSRALGHFTRHGFTHRTVLFQSF